MNESAPLLTSSSTILWLKVALSGVTLVLLYLRYKQGSGSRSSPAATSLAIKAVAICAVLFAFAVFHNLGKPAGGTFVHYGEMFHYYLGSKYFKENGYYGLYNAVVVADSEQDNALADTPFYTNLRTYQNAPRAAALSHTKRIKKRFSTARWQAFKDDLAYFKKETGVPETPALKLFLMDHGYNPSPVSTFVLGTLTNLVPVTQLGALAAIDLLLVALMSAAVFGTFGLEIGALFSVYFCINILNDPGYVSGSLLRYDWLLYIVLAVCLLEKRRHAAAALFLTLAAMIRLFPLALFLGIGVWIVKKARAQRSIDRESKKFIGAAVLTAVALSVLPAIYPGSLVRPWKDFFAKTALHDRGVYVNHLGLRGVALFESSHLSLDAFAEKFSTPDNPDVVRHWQDVKEQEYQDKKPWIWLCSAIVLACLAAIIWRGRDGETGSIIWPLLLVYSASYPSHYYYSFLCLFVVLFLRRPNTSSAFVPLALLLTFNIVALVTDSFGPSPIVFYTLLNIYLFVCVVSIMGFELYTNLRRQGPSTSRSQA